VIFSHINSYIVINLYDITVKNTEKYSYQCCTTKMLTSCDILMGKAQKYEPSSKVIKGRFNIDKNKLACPFLAEIYPSLLITSCIIIFLYYAHVTSSQFYYGKPVNAQLAFGWWDIMGIIQLTKTFQNPLAH